MTQTQCTAPVTVAQETHTYGAAVLLSWLLHGTSVSLSLSSCVCPASLQLVSDDEPRLLLTVAGKLASGVEERFAGSWSV